MYAAVKAAIAPTAAVVPTTTPVTGLENAAANPITPSVNLCTVLIVLNVAIAAPIPINALDITLGFFKNQLPKFSSGFANSRPASAPLVNSLFIVGTFVLNIESLFVKAAISLEKS